MRVLTKHGFSEFERCESRGFARMLLRVELSDGTILKCTHDHEIESLDGVFIPAIFLEVGEELSSNVVVLDVCEIESEEVYDLIEVENETHSYSTGSVESHNCNLLYLDEFAFVQNAEEFYTSTYPVVVSGKSTQVIITSTANGVGNMFYKIWERAVTKTNEYAAFRVDWWDVPGRDEKWKATTIANTSEMQFAQEFSNEFIGTTNTLISPQVLLGLSSRDPEERQFGAEFFEKNASPDHKYVMTVDVSKGRGQDYSTISVFDVTAKPFKQVATYRDNLISPLIFPNVIVKLAQMYNDAIVVIENNDAGQVVCNTIYYELEYENTFVESMTKQGGIGVTMTKKIKRIGCSNLKDLIETGNLVIYDSHTIAELITFEVTGSSYAAAEGCHDDMVMNLVLFAWFVSSDAFGDLSQIDLRDMLYSERMKNIDEDVPLFGHFPEREAPVINPEYEALKRARIEWGI